jgi:hypothetical protein
MSLFAGYNAITHTQFTGVVEDRNDPLKAKRVRVRCFFVHPPDKTLVPTEALEWARVGTNIKLKEGDHVRGYFEDGQDMQQPVVTEKIIGIPETKNDPNTGFNDPRTPTQLQNAPRPPAQLKNPEDGSGVQIVEQAAAVSGYRLNEPLTSRLIRGENLDQYKSMLSVDAISNYPIVDNSMITGLANSMLIKAQQQITAGISALIRKIPGLAPYTATIIRTFFTQPYLKKFTLPATYTLPPSKAAPVYPYNHAVVTESGHIHEVDDTPGAERIHTRHRSGTYEEYYPDGDYVQHVRKDNHVVVDGQDNNIIRGGKQTVVEGSETVTIRGAKYVQIEGQSQVVIIGDANISVQGNASQYVKGDFTQVIGGDYRQTVQGRYTQVLEKDVSRTYSGDVFERYQKDLKQNIFGEWTFRFDNQAFRFEFLQPNITPITNKPINLSTVVLSEITASTGDDSALDGPAFSIQPTMKSKAIDTLSSIDPSNISNIDIANVGFSIANTADSSGFFVV